MKVEVDRVHRLVEDFFHVDEVWVSFEQFDGAMSPIVRRLVVQRRDGVAALLYHRTRRTLLFGRQFRYPSYTHGDGWVVECFAGMLDHGECPEDAMKREILEEAGYRVERLEPITTFYVSPGGSTERNHLFFAEVDDGDRISHGGGETAEVEDIRLEEIPVDQLDEWLRTGQCKDGKTTIAVYWYLRNRYTASPSR